MNDPWRPLTTVTPETSGTGVQLDSPLAHTRARLHRDGLARLLAGDHVPGALTDKLASLGIYGADLEDGAWPEADLRLWQEHGWGLSLATYAWSRQVDYVDSGPAANTDREMAIAEMRAERSCPQPPETSADRATDVGECDALSASVSKVLDYRRSVGTFGCGAIRREALATLLHHGTRKMRNCRKRAASGHWRDILISVGSAIDVYVVCFAVDDVEPGAYRYCPETSVLETRNPGSHRRATHDVLAGQPDPRKAAATVFFVADFDRYQWRYRHERALRNLYLEVGRLMQHLVLTATALDLRTGITPAIRDSQVASLLQFDGDNTQALHSLSIGTNHRTAGQR